jgi:acetyl esterase/lipase
LADLRSATKAYITPAVKQVLASTKVTTRHIVINDVACLEVTPSHITASWPILYGFGGGFIQGSAYEDLTIAAPLCAMTGAALIIPSYRLAPEHPCCDVARKTGRLAFAARGRAFVSLVRS